MARIVKDPGVRRGEILDVAQRLFYQKGYEPTSVQDIISETGIAKGTFYHYFNSKQHLLDAMIERMFAQTLHSLTPLVTDEQLSAPEKLERFFGDISAWKVENKDFFLDLLSTWYKDENAILRYKVNTVSREMTMPLLIRIIEQGVAEGVFATNYPADMAEIVLHMANSFADAIAKIILHKSSQDNTRAIIERKTMVYQAAIERTLNAPVGSLHLFNINHVLAWLG